ncbi:putative uncharacterized protein YDL057W [Typha angustifolia]|uniref:putative uncharacterized protein YDL057W n=1 Tax=Typha angustifolia TaxID=59011 RepID=UPI003C2CB882
MVVSSLLSAALPLLPLRKPKPSSSSLSISSLSYSYSCSSGIFATPETMGSPQTLNGLESPAVFEVEEKSEVPMLSVVAGEDDEPDKLLPGVGSQASLERPDTLLDSSLNGVTSISQQKIVIRNSYGENLAGILHEAGSADLVILCHGFRSSKESRTILNLADSLTSEKISTFCFDFSGNGESEGRFQYGNYWKEVQDLRAVVLYFSKQNRQTRAIVGHSKGGNVVVLYASMYRDISIVINVSGRFDLERGIGDRLGKDYMEKIKQYGFIDVKDKLGRCIYRVTEESLMDRLKTDMQGACLSIDQNCRVLTIHGSEDDIVPPKDALEFAKFITSHRLHIITGADHRYLTHQFELAETVLEFIRSF